MKNITELAYIFSLKPAAVKISPILPDELPDLQLNPELCLELAKKNNPEVFSREVRRLQSARSVDLAKKNSKMKADLNASFGLNQRGSDLLSAYRNPSDQELVGVSLRIPILDWGLSESEYKLAQMQKRAEDAQIQQEEIDFRESEILTVEEFNLQKQLVEGAMEADTIANAVYDITRRRYLNGQSDIIRLSTNLRASIDARRAYIQALERATGRITITSEVLRYMTLRPGKILRRSLRRFGEIPLMHYFQPLMHEFHTVHYINLATHAF